MAVFTRKGLGAAALFWAGLVVGVLAIGVLAQIFGNRVFGFAGFGMFFVLTWLIASDVLGE